MTQQEKIMTEDNQSIENKDVASAVNECYALPADIYYS